MSFFKKLVQDVAKVGEVAAPIIGGIVGGPAGAAVGKMASRGIKAASTPKAVGGPGFNPHAPSFTPSSSGDVAEARSQDKKRMSDQYGIDPRD